MDGTPQGYNILACRLSVSTHAFGFVGDTRLRTHTELIILYTWTVMFK